MNQQTASGQLTKNKQITDTSLKQTLAKMLPEELTWEFQILFWKNKQNDVMLRDPCVLDTELLHLCWLVEETLEPAQCSQYAEVLANKLEIVDDGWYGGWYGGWSINWYEVATMANATWQQRTIALAKVKGIEICQ